MDHRYPDRRAAGRALAGLLGAYASRRDVVVLALPRGGVPVGYEVAQALRAPLDVFVVRKLGTPGHEELALGALASGGVRFVDEALAADLGVSLEQIDEVAREEAAELERRERAYRRRGAPTPVGGRTVILVDDGLATGSTMKAAVKAVKALQPAALIVAVPVGAPETCNALRTSVDELVCARAPDPFYAVGLWYDDFSQTDDDEVCELLEANAREHAADAETTEADVEHRSVIIASHGKLLEGELSLPKGAKGLVIFAHGSGSSRLSPRNRAVAQVLQDAGMATLLLDLLTANEEASERWTRHLRFDLELLAGRLGSARAWASSQEDLIELPVGYFGSSTGAGAALIAAAREPQHVYAVVSRGGRPDLAGEALPDVRAPTLFIVGGEDDRVITLNHEAQQRLVAPSDLRIIPGATHLFEEPGALETVARWAAEWFDVHLGRAPERQVRADNQPGA